jgi:hypothetical protein
MTCLHHKRRWAFDQLAFSSCIYTNLGTTEYGYSIWSEDAARGRLFDLLHIRTYLSRINSSADWHTIISIQVMLQ